MKAVRFHACGEPEVLRVEEVPEPVAGPGEVVVRVHCAALNHLDLWVRRGLPIRIEMPHIGGADFSGVVAATGPGVDRIAAGDAVVGYPLLGFGDTAWPACGDRASGPPVILGEQRNGAFCEALALPAENLVAKPEALSFEDAAAVPVVFLTAWTMLVERARLAAAETLLVLGAGSGVGSAAVQIGRLLGARVIAVTRSEDKAESLRALGAEVVVSDRPARIASDVLRLTEKSGAQIVFEHVGGPLWPTAITCAAYGGRVVCCGATADRFGRLDLRALFAKQLEIHGVTLGSRSSLERVLGMVGDGALHPVIDRVLPLDRCREGHERLEAGLAAGKIVLRAG